MLAQAMRLIACAIEQWDEPDGSPPEPSKLIDQDRVERDTARATLKRRGLL